MNTYELMERCANIALNSDTAEVPTIIEALAHADWQVRYAAAIAAGDLAVPETIPSLLAMMAGEDAAPLYTQPPIAAGGSAGSSRVQAPVFPAGTTPDTIEAWRRRGRLKQAGCLALGAIGQISSEALTTLHRYAVDAGEDYPVRAAACQALGLLAQTESREVLQRASEDEEWCTKTEARKALQRLPA